MIVSIIAAGFLCWVRVLKELVTLHEPFDSVSSVVQVSARTSGGIYNWRCMHYAHATI